MQGLTCAVTIRDGSRALFLDFADMRFKADGWVEKQAWLDEVDAGVYATMLNVSAIKGISGMPWLAATYEVIHPEYTAVVSELIQIVPDPPAASMPVAEPKQDSKTTRRRRVL